MKHYRLILICLAAWMMSACTQNTYSNLRNKEDKLIANYISRNKLNILTTEPTADYQWGPRDYFKVPTYDDLYFHLIDRGDTLSDRVVTNDVIIVRYKQFPLTENADTTSYWTTLDQAHPMEFHLGNTGDCDAVGWHVAVQLMKYPEAQCEVIVPSKLGFSAEQTSVTPLVYIMKIKVKQ